MKKKEVFEVLVVVVVLVILGFCLSILLKDHVEHRIVHVSYGSAPSTPSTSQFIFNSSSSLRHFPAGTFSVPFCALIGPQKTS